MIRKVELFTDTEEYAFAADAEEVTDWVDRMRDVQDLAAWLREDPRRRRIEVHDDHDAILGDASSIDELFTLFENWLASIPRPKFSLDGFSMPTWPEQCLELWLVELEA